MANLAGLSSINISMVASHKTHTLTLATNNTLRAFGSNDKGQLGVGNTNAHSGIVQVNTAVNGLNGKTISAISVGAGFSVLFTSDGKIFTWGDNEKGRKCKDIT
eukprot:GEZU01016195.1.p1 GENE.GEZU01016195.1~~GEZU01016195.1.p1  ORF type:complete len:104 (+),score=21.56 GEZU01016195.1:319-630(+)